MKATTNRITAVYRWFSIFMVCAFATSLVVFLINILFALELLEPGWSESVLGLTGIIAFALVGVALVFSWILLYRFWQIIQDDKPRTTPGKAVGYCFIPVFNCYWIYVAVYGLARHLNRRTNQLHVNVKPVPVAAAFVFCSWSWMSVLTLRILQDPMYHSDLLAHVTVTLLIVIPILLLWILMASFARVGNAIIDALPSSVPPSS